MTESILNHKKLLLVDDESDFLDVFEEVLLNACPDIMIDKATGYYRTTELLKEEYHDLVVLDIVGVRVRSARNGGGKELQGSDVHRVYQSAHNFQVTQHGRGGVSPEQKVRQYGRKSTMNYTLSLPNLFNPTGEKRPECSGTIGVEIEGTL